MKILKKINRERIKFTRNIKFNFKIFFSYKTTPAILEINKCRNIGILFYGKQLGDTLVMSSILRPLKENNFKIFIFCDDKAKTILENNEYLDQLIIIKSLKHVDKYYHLNIDLLIDLTYNTLSEYHRMILKEKINPIYSIYLYLHTSTRKEPSYKKLTRIHNEAIIYREYNKHCENIYKHILERLNIRNYERLRYVFNLKENNLSNAKNFVSNFDGKKIIIFNPFAANDKRSLSIEKTINIMTYLNAIHDHKTIVIGDPRIINSLPCLSNVIKFISNDISDAIALLSLSDMVISVDTSIVHFSKIFNKKLISLYNNLMWGQFNNNLIWSPNYNNSTQLFSKSENMDDVDQRELYQEIQRALI